MGGVGATGGGGLDAGGGSTGSWRQAGAGVVALTRGGSVRQEQGAGGAGEEKEIGEYILSLFILNGYNAPAFIVLIGLVSQVSNNLNLRKEFSYFFTSNYSFFKQILIYFF